MEHETDYQRARRQRQEVKKFGVTGSTPEHATKRIKEHVAAKHNALKAAQTGKRLMAPVDAPGGKKFDVKR